MCIVFNTSKPISALRTRILAERAALRDLTDEQTENVYFGEGESLSLRARQRALFQYIQVLEAAYESLIKARDAELGR